MGLLTKLPAILKECKEEYRNTTCSLDEFILTEQVGERHTGDFGNVLAKGDNAAFMKYLLKCRKMEGKIKLIYIDPPFYSKSDYGTAIRLESEKVSKIPIIKQTAYQDTWENGMEEYLRMLAFRLLFMKDLLTEDGGIWVHLDWHVVHYVKLIMDEIFGAEHFVNEVIWNYKSGGVSKRYFARKHDTLLYYSKTPKYYFNAQKEKSYNRALKPYRFKGVEEYQDEIGWYTMVNKKDVWQIDMVGRTSSERTGYATQKPELLIQTILESCTKEGDLCADFFGGSGTLAAAAHKMGRNFIHCDMGELSLAHAYKRFLFHKIPFQYWECENKLEGKQKKENKKDKFKIEAQFSAGQNSLGEPIFSVELLSYRINFLKNGLIAEEQKKLLRKIMKEEPLLLVDYWMIDFHYDGNIFKPEAYDRRLKSALAARAQIDGGEISCVMLCVVDVFGNRAFIKWGNENEMESQLLKH